MTEKCDPVLRVQFDDRVEFGICPTMGAAITLPVIVGDAPTPVSIYVVATAFQPVTPATVDLVRRVAKLVAS